MSSRSSRHRAATRKVDIFLVAAVGIIVVFALLFWSVGEHESDPSDTGDYGDIE